MTQRWGLAAAGGISRSFVGRLPKLASYLGPVASTSYRLAARISNALRAGKPVREFGLLQAADTILLCVPGGSLSLLVDQAAVQWEKKIVLICDSPNDPQINASLRGQGAAVCTIDQLAELPDRYLIVGDRVAGRLARSLVESLHGRAIEVPREQLLIFQAALTFAGSFFTPLLETALDCLRRSGIEQPEAAKLTEALFQHSLRTFRHAGRKSWAGPVAFANQAALTAQGAALQAAKPLMASYFNDAARYSLELYQSFPELTRYNKSRWKNFQKRYQEPS